MVVLWDYWWDRFRWYRAHPGTHLLWAIYWKFWILKVLLGVETGHFSWYFVGSTGFQSHFLQFWIEILNSSLYITTSGWVLEANCLTIGTHPSDITELFAMSLKLSLVKVWTLHPPTQTNYGRYKGDYFQNHSAMKWLQIMNMIADQYIAVLSFCCFATEMINTWMDKHYIFSPLVLWGITKSFAKPMNVLFVNWHPLQGK